MVWQHISHKYIELKLSVFMMTGSYYGFLLNAGHVWRTSRDLFLCVHNWNSTRGKPWCGGRMDLWAFMYQKGIAKVSVRVSLWDWREFGKKEQFQALHANMNELIVFQDSRYIKILQGIAFGSSPYRFPWFGATFKTKERLTRRLLQQHFCRFLIWK